MCLLLQSGIEFLKSRSEFNLSLYLCYLVKWQIVDIDRSCFGRLNDGAKNASALDSDESACFMTTGKLLNFSELNEMK